MQTMEPQQTFLSERHGDLGGLRARSIEACTSQHAAAKRRARPALTRRQLEVATLLVETGLSYKEIAARLGLREGTMRKHAENIYRAFGVHSRPELTVAFRATWNVSPSAPQA